MKGAKNLLTVGIPSVVGLGAAWLVATFIRSERRLEQRRVELKAQLDLMGKGLRETNCSDQISKR